MEKRSILQNKLYLYLTEFFSGMSLMAVELGASRLLAPYFSSSQIVWTIIIGVIMIAMALGNLYGGKIADKDPNPDVLYRHILIAAIWIAAIPFLGRYVIIAIAGILIYTINTNLLVIAAFLSCLVLFVYPLFLLGTVTPSLVKFTVDSLEDSGETVGKLNACNTIGSIIGTFTPTFITIPAVGTSVTFLIFAGILLVLCLVYFLSSKKNTAVCVAASVAFIVLCVLSANCSFAFWDDAITYEGESVYNYLQVKDDEDQTVLSTNVLFGVQSVRNKEDGLTGLYYDYDLAAPVIAGTDAPKVLVLGNCAGTFASQCRKYFPSSEVEGVEIDGKITDLAKQYFALPEEVSVTEYDGRAYLYAVDEKYDVIQVDAYQDITIPFQMSSVEFFQLVKEHLTENGVLVVNMNMHSESEGNINEYLSDTIASVFDNVYTVDVPGCSNRELFAVLTGDVKERYDESVFPELRMDWKRYTGGDCILTDDKAPVELLGMKMIDELIEDELAWYKQYSLKELISLLSA